MLRKHNPAHKLAHPPRSRLRPSPRPAPDPHPYIRLAVRLCRLPRNTQPRQAQPSASVRGWTCSSLEQHCPLAHSRAKRHSLLPLAPARGRRTPRFPLPCKSRDADGTRLHPADGPAGSLLPPVGNASLEIPAPQLPSAFVIRAVRRSCSQHPTYAHVDVQLTQISK